MAPVNGDTKTEGGLDWVYQEPPGAWIVEPGHSPLERALGMHEEQSGRQAVQHEDDAVDDRDEQDEP